MSSEGKISENHQENVCCTSDVNSQKLHVLALHGYRQNGEVFRQKTGSFRKLVHKWARFTYITAPHKVIMVDDLENINQIDQYPQTGILHNIKLIYVYHFSQIECDLDHITSVK